MAKVTYVGAIEQVSGALIKKSKKEPCKQQAMAKHLSGSSWHNRLYLGNPAPRSTPPTAKEMALHTKFRTVSQARDERSQDLMNMTQDQEAYRKARKVTGFKYHSFRAWLFAKAWENYKEDSHSVVWPAQGL